MTCSPWFCFIKDEKKNKGEQNFVVYPSPLRQIQFPYSDERNMAWALPWRELNSGLSPREIYPGQYKGCVPPAAVLHKTSPPHLFGQQRKRQKVAFSFSRRSINLESETDNHYPFPLQERWLKPEKMHNLYLMMTEFPDHSLKQSFLNAWILMSF